MPINNIPISAAIITLNEENNLADCLSSLSWADEIVIVDSLSTDRTVEIAEKFGATVISQKFLGHVKQKQLAVDSCQYDWVICLDADERVSKELSENIQLLFSKTAETDLAHGYTMSRCSFHLGRWIRHGGWYPDRNIRLFNRKYGKWGGVDPHDKIEISRGEAGHLKGDLLHYVFKDLAHNIATNNFYSGISADIFYREGKKPSMTKLFLKPFGKFLETYIIKRGFLDGLPGFIISVGAAYSMFLKFAKLWEHHIREDQRKQEN